MYSTTLLFSIQCHYHRTTCFTAKKIQEIKHVQSILVHVAVEKTYIWER